MSVCLSVCVRGVCVCVCVCARVRVCAKEFSLFFKVVNERRGNNVNEVY